MRDIKEIWEAKQDDFVLNILGKFSNKTWKGFVQLKEAAAWFSRHYFIVLLNML